MVLDHEVCKSQGVCAGVRAHLSWVIAVVCVQGLVLEDRIRLQLLPSPVTTNSQPLSNESGSVNAECHLTTYYTALENMEYEKHRIF